MQIETWPVETGKNLVAPEIYSSESEDDYNYNYPYFINFKEIKLINE